LHSRLIVGSGKYKDFPNNKDATLISGSELITVAIRRVNITNPKKKILLDYFKDTNIKMLPNSAGCTTAEEAITLLDL
jgi:thiazole synthase